MFKQTKFRRKLSAYISRYFLYIFWIFLNILIFVCSFEKYKNEPQYYYLREMLGYGLCISRSSGTVINVSCALILLPMCRSLTTVVRRLNQSISFNSIRFVMNRCKSIHLICAYTLFSSSAIHTVAHVVNAFNFCRHFSFKHPDLNLAQFSGQNPMIAMFTTVPGVSGILMNLILIFICLTSIKFIRGRFYNVFWYSHHLVVVFLVLLVCHPLSGILKEQVNLERHPPGCITTEIGNETKIATTSINTTETPTTLCLSPPRFLPQKSQTWKWMLIPLSVYALDVLFRRIHRTGSATVTKVRHLPCSIMELSLKKKNFIPKPGQFVMLNCPSVSPFEWHPFSVSSVCKFDRYTSPDEFVFRVHIRTRGDWSKKLSDVLVCSPRADEHVLSTSKRDFVKFYIDGPFGSPFENVLNCAVSVCIAGGIGITPIASILDALLTDKVDFGRLQHLHLIWLCRDIRSILWFADILCRLHFKLWNMNKPDFLQIELYLTMIRSHSDIKDLLGEKYFLLIPRVEIGRPNWKSVFRDLRLVHERSKYINIFSCGPKSLNIQIKTICATENKNMYGPSFIYHHESFS